MVIRTGGCSDPAGFYVIFSTGLSVNPNAWRAVNPAAWITTLIYVIDWICLYVMITIH